MFLESHFGEDAISPISKPRLAPTPALSAAATEPATNDTGEQDPTVAEKEHARREAGELERLHALGIPVPGLEIAFDKHVARIWLETLEVECSVKTLGDRVRAVVDRAVETVAPLWA